MEWLRIFPSGRDPVAEPRLGDRWSDSAEVIGELDGFVAYLLGGERHLEWKPLWKISRLEKSLVRQAEDCLEPALARSLGRLSRGEK